MEKLKFQNDIGTVEMNTLKHKPFYELSKRIFDIISSAVALVILSPVFIFLIVVIKLDSEGEAIFGHNRLGKNGKLIKIYKFRTMVKNAQEILNNLPPQQKREFEENFKLENDPRITKLGKFLRETSLDELPQLFNILIGNMSVVGPRPIVEKEIEKYGEYGDKLLSVKPGLTGNWQANGRSNTTYEERVQLDMCYIDNRSFLFDIKIILKTVVSVLKKEGAV
ncbi:putative undecaprenyl-phosphate galactose phosphotransferase [Clostridiales bacterium oral taxon 876 str. F0540]|nr:putative undecaprenyl-phosphate galactose phosphotransferase [Clostridiales bacterium oral taxon 876 str. F0540]